jgi:N-acetylglucosaminylphosphatidylinositol deacetylase
MLLLLLALLAGGASLWPLLSRAVRWASPPPPARVLLVFAHPDDESMFFAPALASLAASGSVLHFLCLSTGNFDGLGAVRRKELLAAAAVLGVAPERVAVLDDAALQDGMRSLWPPATVARHVDAAVRRWGADAVLTFDGRGVSGHPNHVATHAGVLAYLAAAPPPPAGGPRPAVWTLTTTGLLRKYASLLDLPLTLAGGALSAPGARRLFLSPNVLRGVAAMAAHRSQWVWFRRLFVAFSRYTFINDFTILGAPGGGAAATGSAAGTAAAAAAGRQPAGRKAE